MRKVLQPKYMAEFNCIGTACEDSCCIGWRVELDKKTYHSYKNNKNSVLTDDFNQYVTRYHNKPKEEKYGRIRMRQDGRCPFLNEKNLCNIYINLGEDHLSETCTYYPRVVNIIDGGYERGASASCPEIARKVLLNKGGLEFEAVEENPKSNIKIDRRLDTEGHLFLNKPQRYFWEIRLFAISLLQNRSYSLGERLILLGIVYNRIDELVKNSKAKNIPSMLENMSVLIEKDELRGELNNVPYNAQIQMRLAKELTDEKVAKGFFSERYKDCLKETLFGLEYIVGQPFANVLSLYEKHNEEILKPYLKENEHLLENFLVNYYFTEMMPFGRYKTPWDSYVFLCVLLSVVKIHLIGMAGHHGKMTDDLFVKLIQSLSKVMLHDPQYIQKMVYLLKENELDSLAYMSILVKD